LALIWVKFKKVKGKVPQRTGGGKRAFLKGIKGLGLFPFKGKGTRGHYFWGKGFNLTFISRRTKKGIKGRKAKFFRLREKFFGLFKNRDYNFFPRGGVVWGRFNPRRKTPHELKGKTLSFPFPIFGLNSLFAPQFCLWGQQHSRTEKFGALTKGGRLLESYKSIFFPRGFTQL